MTVTDVDSNNSLDLLRSLDLVLRQCDGHDRLQANAHYMLGELHEWGEANAKHSLEQAVEHYTTAATLGHADAHAALGLLYAIGGGVAQNDALSLLHYEFGSIGDSLAAHAALGYRHLFGRGVERSCERALLHYDNAARRVVDEVEASGLHPIGRATRIETNDESGGGASDEFDDGQRRRAGDEADMLEYYEYASDRDASTLITLGMLYLQGNGGVKRDFARALQLFRDAETRGARAAADYLAHRDEQHAAGEKTKEKFPSNRFLLFVSLCFVFVCNFEF